MVAPNISTIDKTVITMDAPPKAPTCGQCAIDGVDRRIHSPQVVFNQRAAQLTVRRLDLQRRRARHEVSLDAVKL